MDRPSSFRPLNRVPSPDGGPGIYLEDPESGETISVTHAVTDAADGVTDEDFDFDAGARWAQGTTDAAD